MRKQRSLRHWRLGVATVAAGMASLVAGAVPVATDAATATTTGLVAAYSFDAGAGLTLADDSGNGNTGTISGPVWTTYGKFGSALRFDGVDDWVTVADAPELDLGGPLTLEAWVRPTALGFWKTVLMKEQPGNLTYGLFADSDSAQPTGQVYVGGQMIVRGSAQLPLSTWSHLAATYDGLYQRLYVNGQLVGSRAQSGAVAVSNGVLRIGGNSVYANEWFQGRIDEVRIYSRALTRAEIEADMNTAVAAAPEPGPSGPVAAYSMDAGSGSTLADDSGTGNVGTLGGPAWNAGGRFGGALSFDGVDDWVTIADSASLDLSTALTLEAWVKPSQLGFWKTVLMKEQPGNLTYGLFADSDSAQPTGQVYVGGQMIVRGSAQLPLNTWTHLATTYDGVNQLIYVDGQLVGSRAQTGEAAVSGGVLRIGGNSVYANEWFKGLIDEVRIYARALSQAEIQSDMSKAIAGGASGDTSAPSAPANLQSTGATQTSVSLSWSASSDNVGVTGYDVYRDGTRLGTTTSTSYTASGLACGTSYTFGVEALDAAGNRSARSAVVASTASCPTGDTTPPSAPTGLTKTGSTTTSVSISWTASTDNVGVTGYDVFRNGTAAGTTTTTSYSFSGLSCGTSYTFGVEAKDAAGNRSTRSTLTASTSACAPSSATVYLSPGGADTNPCTQASPCRSLDRGYRVAAPGQVVELAGGSYSGGTVNTDSTKTSTADVVFRPAAGASVTISSEVNVRGDHMTFQDMKFGGGWKTYPETDDVTFRNLSMRHFFLWSSTNINIIGGELGPSDGSDYDSQISEYSGSRVAPRNILIDGVDFHDWWRPAGSDYHTECLQVGAGVNVTIRNSRFWNCATHDIFIRSWGGINNGIHELKGWLIENNFFARTQDGYYAIQFVNDLGFSPADFLVRNNSFLQGIYVDGPSTNVTVDSNIFNEQATWGCSADVYRYNIYETLQGSGGPCGSTDRVAAVQYVNRAALDLHLRAGSPGVDQGNPTSYPATDIDGQSRPRGSAPDVGADEL